MRGRALVTVLVVLGGLALPRLRAASADRRQLGWQVGGSGFLEAVARGRVYRGLSVEVGGFAITHAVNLSVGAELEAFRRGPLGIYTSAGGAIAGAFGPVPADAACMPTTEDCAYVPGGTMLAFGYARAGVRWRFHGGTRAVSVEIGGWLGRWNVDNGPDQRSGWFAAPVAGLGYLWLRP